jgi:hypothetical protein
LLKNTKKICDSISLFDGFAFYVLARTFPSPQLPTVFLSFSFISLNSKLGLTLSGIGLLGFSVSFVFVPLLPEIVAAISEKEGIEQTPFLCDKASGIFNSAYGIGNCLAPLVGAALTQFLNFRYTCDIMGFASLAFFFIYFFFAVLPAILQKPKTHDPLEEAAPDSSLTMDMVNTSADFKPKGPLNDSSNMSF